MCVSCVLIGVYCGGPHGQFRKLINHPRNICHDFSHSTIANTSIKQYITPCAREQRRANICTKHNKGRHVRLTQMSFGCCAVRVLRASWRVMRWPSWTISTKSPPPTHLCHNLSMDTKGGALARPLVPMQCSWQMLRGWWTF
jgi:hypothetical protein